MDEPRRRPGQSSLTAAACHASHENTVVGVSLHHANPVTEHCAAGNWARWIDGEYGHSPVTCTYAVEERGHERALSYSGWTRQTDNVSVSRTWVEHIKCGQSARILVFHESRQTGEHPPVGTVKMN
jgi:hypothetical protein